MYTHRKTVIPLVLIAIMAAGCSATPKTSHPRITRPALRRDASDNHPELKRAVNPDAAHRWRHRRWEDEHGIVPRDARQRALAHRATNVGYWAASAFDGSVGLAPENWIERRPDNLGGRTRSLLIDPDNPEHMWAGSVSGGIWSTTDAGQEKGSGCFVVDARPDRESQRKAA